MSNQRKMEVRDFSRAKSGGQYDSGQNRRVTGKCVVYFNTHLWIHATKKFWKFPRYWRDTIAVFPKHTGLAEHPHCMKTQDAWHTESNLWTQWRPGAEATLSRQQEEYSTSQIKAIRLKVSLLVLLVAANHSWRIQWK